MGIIICITKDTKNLLMLTKRQASEVANGGVCHGSLKYKLRRSISLLWHIQTHSPTYTNTHTHKMKPSWNPFKITHKASWLLLCLMLECQKTISPGDALSSLFKLNNCFHWGSYFQELKRKIYWMKVVWNWKRFCIFTWILCPPASLHRWEIYKLIFIVGTRSLTSRLVFQVDSGLYGCTVWHSSLLSLFLFGTLR